MYLYNPGFEKEEIQGSQHYQLVLNGRFILLMHEAILFIMDIISLT